MKTFREILEKKSDPDVLDLEAWAKKNHPQFFDSIRSLQPDSEYKALLKLWNKKGKPKLQEKINQKDYRFWVVVDNKIQSGWEFEEDAMDILSDLPPGKKGKIYVRKGLKNIGLVPEKDTDWMVG